MNEYSKDSLQKLSTCDPRLQMLFKFVLQIMDHKILEGHRGEVAQNEAFAKGRSKLKWPYGNHNKLPSLAVDAIPVPVNWDDTNRICYFSGIVMGVAKCLKIPIRWGNDWDGDTDIKDQTLNDLPHFELKT